MTLNTRIKVSVIIKALNEEHKIASTIESALRAISAVGGEVILADSLSTDRTIAIASQYPIKIVQLSNPGERCCGIGGQLGYQCVSGEYIWIVDGDMVLAQGFIEDALKYLDADPSLAGVGGRVVEKNLESLEFRARLSRAPENLRPGVVDRLDGGGVYKRSAIKSVGYFTNRNLHSYEEYELAARLRSGGWLLKRINVESVSHYGHKIEAYALLRRRCNSGYILGIGELLKSAIGQPHLTLVLHEVRELRLYTIVVLWWISLTFSLLGIASDVIGSQLAAALVLVSPFAVMAIKKKSISTAIYSVISWNFYTFGLILGLLKRQYAPATEVLSKPIQSIAESNVSSKSM